MHQNAVTDKPAPDVAFDIQSELTRLAYDSLQISLLAVLINSTILAFMQWELFPPHIVITWYLVTNGLSLARLILYWKFRQLDPGQTVSPQWQEITFANGVFSGATWGAAAIWLFPADDIIHQTFLAFVIAGMTAGAVSTLAPLRKSLIGFVLLSTTPLMVNFYLVDTPVTYAMSIMCVLFGTMVLVAASRLNATIRESLVMKYKQKLATEVIRRQASFDPLTNLPNRRMLMQRLKQDLSRAIRHGHLGALLFLDLDHFKTVNDSLGHTIGDELLKQVSRRIEGRLREEDTVARLGGDEFIVIMSAAGDEPNEATASTLELTDDILKLLSEPFVVEGHELHISSSIGVVLFPLEDCSTEDLLQKADVAMYEAKEAGRNNARFFLPEMQNVVDNRRIIEKDLRKALQNDELVIYYQPLVDIDNRVYSVEALLRWKHPERGLMSPDEFIGIAEQCGLVIGIGDWVMRRACEELLLAESRDLKVNINVSPRQFVEANFVDKARSVFAETGVDPSRICLEITEGMIVSNMNKAVQKMRELSAIGVSLAIDDFGTGYSSLAYLKRLPVNLLKIDKSFVRDINTDPNDAVIIETIIAMARHMQIDVIAEGVEDQKMLTALMRKGCKKFQGYLFGRPVPMKELVFEAQQCRTG